jgi:RHS repeat-associated protein
VAGTDATDDTGLLGRLQRRDNIYSGSSFDLAKGTVGSTNTKYAYSAGRPLSQQTGANPSYFLEDLHGDVTGSAYTGANPISETLYKPWGQTTNSSSGLPLLGFQGQLTDPTTGLTVTDSRLYDPNMGRFDSQDSVTGGYSDPSSYNQYTYGEDSPVGNSDLAGRTCNADQGTPCGHTHPNPVGGWTSNDNYTNTTTVTCADGYVVDSSSECPPAYSPSQTYASRPCVKSCPGFTEPYAPPPPPPATSPPPTCSGFFNCALHHVLGFAGVVIHQSEVGQAMDVYSALSGQTIGLCAGGSVVAVYASTSSVCYVSTPSGQTGILLSSGHGLGGPVGANASLGLTLSNAQQLSDLAGSFSYVEGSAGEEEASAGGSYAWKPGGGVKQATAGWTPGVNFPYGWTASWGSSNSYVYPSNP